MSKMSKSNVSGATTALINKSLKTKNPPIRSLAPDVAPQSATTTLGCGVPVPATPVKPLSKGGDVVPVEEEAIGVPRNQAATAVCSTYVMASKKLATASRRGVEVKTLSIKSVAVDDDGYRRVGSIQDDKTRMEYDPLLVTAGVKLEVEDMNDGSLSGLAPFDEAAFLPLLPA